ncbi:MAG: RagB/SusD family nutrient uptake outer membrane protein [Bacteroides sp.]|nr:RagB/SusD family nutrient uptake outer membrane protein [Bacteroides sp.]
MKKLYIKAIGALLLGGSMVSCGNDFLDTKMYDSIDMESGLVNVDNIGYALNGVYYRLYYYYFAGNFAVNIGDVASDLSYWNGETGHFNLIYQFQPRSTDTYLYYIWNYGYKVADNSARIIKAGNELYADATEDDKVDLDVYLGEAYALRAYAHFLLVNIYGHQYKVNGQDFGDKPGIVIVDEPIPANTQVSRATVAQTYAQIVSDLKNSIAHFTAAGGDRGDVLYFNLAAANGLLSRVSLYMEDYQASINAAEDAIAESGITELTYDPVKYKALYNYGTSNNESMFTLAITTLDNWSANSSGNIWSSYNFSPSPYLQSLYGANDIRRSIMTWNAASTEQVPIYGGGKVAAFAYGNPAYGTEYLINAPEMFLNQAEAYLKLPTPDINKAKDALLVVAKRNPDIASVSDLPSTADDLMSFIRDERARELFQEGLRLYDLRRWDVMANVVAEQAPSIKYVVNNYKISNFVFPIPEDEINAGFGVTQNEGWASALPNAAN